MSFWMCPNCGYMVNGGVSAQFIEEHECDERSVVRRASEKLDEQFAAFLETPLGQFEVSYAQRRLKEAA